MKQNRLFRIFLLAGPLSAFLLSGGCNKPPPVRSERLGCLQIGEGGRLCSGETAFLAGPRVGLGRNEGQHKSTGEVFAVVPGFGLPAKLGGAWDAYYGKSAAAHYDDRNPFNQMVFPDNLAALRLCREKKLASPERLRETCRLLLRSNYLNTDLLEEAVVSGAVRPDELRELVVEWMELYDPKAQHNLFLTRGNEAWLSRLVKWNVFSKAEAGERLKRELSKHRRHDAGRLADAYRLEVEPKELLDERLRREVERALNRLPDRVAPAGRLRVERIKPIGRGGIKPFLAGMFIGPRTAYGLNEGQSVTALEALCGVPVLSTGPRLYLAVLAKKGHFFTQEAFENDVFPPHHRERRALLRLAVEQGVLTVERHREALRKMCALDCPTLDLIEEAAAAAALSADETAQLAGLIGNHLDSYLPGRYEERFFERLAALGGIPKADAPGRFEAWLRGCELQRLPQAGLRDAVRAQILDERGLALLLQERFCRIRYYELLDREFNDRGGPKELAAPRREWRRRALLADGLPVTEPAPAETSGQTAPAAETPNASLVRDEEAEKAAASIEAAAFLQSVHSTNACLISPPTE